MLEYKENELHVESVSLRHVCQRFGTPVYVYSKAKVEERVALVVSALRQDGGAHGGKEARLHFPVKCNFNLAILDLLHRRGLSFDVASEGELRRVLKIGADPSKVVFTGVGKSRREIEFALQVGIGCFHVESRQELERIEDVARCRSIGVTSRTDQGNILKMTQSDCGNVAVTSGKYHGNVSDTFRIDHVGATSRKDRNVAAPVAVRVNVNVETKTHGYITTGSCNTKFGIPLKEAEDAYVYAHSSVYLSVEGIHCHIGSQITDIAPYKAAISTVLTFVTQLDNKGVRLKFFDIGGGFGVRYRHEDPLLPWNEWLGELVRPIWDMGLEVHLEPGRVIMAESGALVTEVLYTKKMADKNYVIVDAAMNDFIRPALYDGYHEILNVRKDDSHFIGNGEVYDVVGPLCESSDIMGLNRRMSEVSQGDLLVVSMAGAYGSAIMSNFSSRPRPAEVLVDGSRLFLIKERETYDHVMKLDKLPSKEDEWDTAKE